MCELTNLAIQEVGLKIQELRQSVSDWREYRGAAVDSMRKLTCFLNIKACKTILIVTQNKMMNRKMSIIESCSSVDFPDWIYFNPLINEYIWGTVLLYLL